MIDPNRTCPHCNGPISKVAKLACKECIGKVLAESGSNSLSQLKPIPFSSENQPDTPGIKPSKPNRSTIYKRILNTPVVVEDDNGELLSLSLHEAIALGQARSAMEGNTQAWKEIQDSIYGKQTEKTELTGADGQPLETISTIVIQGVKPDGKSKPNNPDS